MKLYKRYFRVFGIAMCLGIFPLLGSARDFHARSVGIFQQDDKDGKKKKEPEKKDNGKETPDPKAEAKRPAVKEVPKARPKLRPEVVTDKIKIKRPPVKLKTSVLHSIRL